MNRDIKVNMSVTILSLSGVEIQLQVCINQHTYSHAENVGRNARYLQTENLLKFQEQDTLFDTISQTETESKPDAPLSCVLNWENSSDIAKSSFCPTQQKGSENLALTLFYSINLNTE